MTHVVIGRHVGGVSPDPHQMVPAVWPAHRRFGVGAGIRPSLQDRHRGRGVPLPCLVVVRVHPRRAAATGSLAQHECEPSIGLKVVLAIQTRAAPPAVTSGTVLAFGLASSWRNFQIGARKGAAIAARVTANRRPGEEGGIRDHAQRVPLWPVRVDSAEGIGGGGQGVEAVRQSGAEIEQGCSMHPSSHVEPTLGVQGQHHVVVAVPLHVDQKPLESPGILVAPSLRNDELAVGVVEARVLVTAPRHEGEGDGVA
mmetsp:Transcript_50161/g.131862  ORF Transcript_50161/g.131862 Transcript_50161/m.131862 type:complete len:255 (+) Transcript_50161:107-871(+)